MGGRWQAWRRLADWLRGRLGGRPGTRKERGRRGEQTAAHYLQSRGFRILERNYTVRRGEIDLIAFRNGTLVFVEVRSVTAPAAIDPLLTVTPGKQQRVVRAAQAYMAGRGHDPGIAYRFDVVAVVMARDGRRLNVRHVPNAFHAGGRGFS